MKNLSHAWGSVTSPTRHDPENFRYLVHAINPIAALTVPTFSLHAKLAGKDSPNPADGDQSISLYDFPERLIERVTLSMSLIDQSHTGTWGDAGLIIEAPEQNILLTSPHDCGALNFDLAALELQARNIGRTNGDSLLIQTGPHQYNEVVARANFQGNQLALAGFFYKTNRKGKPVNEALANKMHIHASRLGLPIVGIVDKTLAHNNEIVCKEGRVSAWLDDVCYRLTGHDKPFTYIDMNLGTRFITPETLAEILDYMSSQGTDKGLLQSVQTHSCPVKPRQG